MQRYCVVVTVSVHAALTSCCSQWPVGSGVVFEELLLEPLLLEFELELLFPLPLLLLPELPLLLLELEPDCWFELELAPEDALSSSFESVGC